MEAASARTGHWDVTRDGTRPATQNYCRCGGGAWQLAVGVPTCGLGSRLGSRDWVEGASACGKRTESQSALDVIRSTAPAKAMPGVYGAEFGGGSYLLGVAQMCRPVLFDDARSRCSWPWIQTNSLEIRDHKKAKHEALVLQPYEYPEGTRINRNQGSIQGCSVIRPIQPSWALLLSSQGMQGSNLDSTSKLLRAICHPQRGTS
jgi:hypothetical protein